MKMTRLHMMLLSLTVSLMVSAQGMTYNHDEVIMNQFMKAEIGSGTLGNGGWFADQYYKLTHSSYRSMANNPVNNKLASRTLTNAEVTKEEKYAETIKDSLEKRAEIEALNIADRQVDVEWLVEKNKIQRQQNILKKNIEDIVFYGGTSEDKTAWTQIYNMVQESLDSAHDAYMPNSQRKAVYVLLYKDLCQYNVTLNKLKNIWWSERFVRDHKDKTFSFSKSRSMVKDCYGRWKVAWSGKSNNGGHGGSGGIGIDAGSIEFGNAKQPKY